MKNKYLIAFYLMLMIQTSNASEWSGNITIEDRAFFRSADLPQQHNNTISISAQPEFSTDWDKGRQSFTFVPFARIDQHDEERSHADIRELTWLKAANDWELRVGIRKLFWGVTESQHLVDIINQTDAVESIDGEEKLGQPMINYAFINDWGTLDIFALIGFRERTFSGLEGRPKPAIVIDSDQTTYESSRQQRHIDYAIRWSHSIGDWDVGISHFDGTNRDPTLVLNQNTGKFNPHYSLIKQTGLDVQLISESWLWKLEVISRDSQANRYTAATGGVEYSFYGILETQIDLGLIAEYLYDDRENNIETLFGNDIMIGGRFALNDEQSTEFLIGVIWDIDKATRLYSVEASRRLGDSWKLNLETRIFSNIDNTSPLLYSQRNDDFLEASLAWYF